MKILVTGASGFIGSFLVEEGLRRGDEVWAGVRSGSPRRYLRDRRIRFVELDFAHPEILSEQLVAWKQEYGRWDAVIHCAGVTKCPRKEEFMRGNYVYTRRLVETLQALEMVPEQFIYISSLSVFGPVREKEYTPIEEKDTPLPDTAYGMSKLESERYLQGLSHFPYVIFRPTGVYGPREKDYFLMAKSIRRHVDFSVGYKRQDLTFVYVKDLVKAVYLALDRQVLRRAYFVSDGKVYASRAFSDLIRKELGNPYVIHLKCPLFVLKVVSLLAEKVAALFGKNCTLNGDKYKIMRQRNWQCDIFPLVSELGYRPDYDLERGVKEIIAWYRKEKWL